MTVHSIRTAAATSSTTTGAASGGATAASGTGIGWAAATGSAGGDWTKSVARKRTKRGKKKRPKLTKKLKTKRPVMPGLKIFRGNRSRNRKGAKRMNLLALHIKNTTRYSGRFPSRKQVGAYSHDELAG